MPKVRSKREMRTIEDAISACCPGNRYDCTDLAMLALHVLLDELEDAGLHLRSRPDQYDTNRLSFFDMLAQHSVV